MEEPYTPVIACKKCIVLQKPITYRFRTLDKFNSQKNANSVIATVLCCVFQWINEMHGLGLSLENGFSS